MIVVMRTGAARSEIEAVKQAIRGAGLEPYPVIGEERTVIAVGSDGSGGWGRVSRPNKRARRSMIRNAALTAA